MAKKRILNTDGLEEGLKRFEKICTQKPVDKEAAYALFRKLNQRLGKLRSSLFVLLNQIHREEERPKIAQPPQPKNDPPPIEKPRIMYSFSPTPNYETPTTPHELKELLKKTFGASDKSLEFSDQLLEQAMAQAHLEHRGDWAVYLTLLSDPEVTLDETELVDSTGYSIGSVSGSLCRLLEQDLVRKTENNRYVATISPNSPASL